MNIVDGTLVRPTMDFVAGLDVVKPRGAVLRPARAKPAVRRDVVRADFPVVFPFVERLAGSQIPQAGEFVHRTGHEFHIVWCKIQQEHSSVVWHFDDFLVGLPIPHLRRVVRSGFGNVSSVAGREVKIFDILLVAPLTNHFTSFQVRLSRCAVASAGERGFTFGRYGCDDEVGGAHRFESIELLAVFDALCAALFTGAGYGDFRVGREIDRVFGQAKRRPFDLA